MEAARGDAGLTRAAPLLLVPGLLLAACGGDDHLSKDEYVKRFRAATQEALVAGQANGRAEDLRAVAILRTLAGRIDALNAPKEVEDPQKEFVAAVRAQAAELQHDVEAYRAGDKKALDASRRRGGPSPEIAEREERALEEYKEKGYRVANLD